MPSRVALIILDGWGEAPAWGGNAITTAATPVIDQLRQTAISLTLEAAGEAVGLKWGEPGNSEVGHLTIGAGRVLRQDRTRINDAIADGSFARNPVLVAAYEQAKAADRTVHLIGLASRGGVHGHIDHLRALLELARDRHLRAIRIHAITDGRDTPPQQAAQELDRIRHWCTEFGVGQLVSIVGRSFAMDRDEHWDRTERAYRLLTEPHQSPARSALAAISAAYAAGQTDEFIEPVWLDPAIPPIQPGDVVIGWNFRPDRSRQLFDALANATFRAFGRTQIPNVTVVTFTPYWPELDHAGIRVAFPPEAIPDGLAAVVSTSQLRQLRIAETEKYAHVTYFLNGGREQPFDGEDHTLIPSKLAESPALHPLMQTAQIARAVERALRQQRYGLIVANIAAPDMVGHTGDLRATTAACEAVDRAIGTIVEACRATSTVLVVTADHGNAEQLVDPVTNGPDTHHTANPVPYLVVDPTGTLQPRSQPRQTLADIAPTILTILGLDVPHSMTGHSLVGAQIPNPK